jgi:nucleotide-binding universal stress UspA family protein
MTTLPRRILVPVDSGPRSDEAVAHAVALARALDSELLLLGVVPLPAVGPLEVPPAPDGIADHDDPTDSVVERRLERTRAGEAAGVRSRSRLGWAPAGPAILRAATEEGVDLVVMPSEQGGGREHVLHDPPGRHVLWHSRVPVLAV